MNRKIGRGDQRAVPDLDSGLEALRRSPEFPGPAESLDGHDHTNDHFALVYESREEQFAAALPFVRQGLERNERCLYIADDNSREEVLEAMRDVGIDVDAARESGALSIHTKEDTYLRSGQFDRDAMLEFWEDSLEQATDGDGYTGIRAAAEMTWATDGGTSLDRLVEYEAVLNDLFSDEDYAVLCQYNRDRFPAEVVHDVVRTHPHLIDDNRVSHNVYYTPPEEFLDSERSAREVDRMLGTLREHAEAKEQFTQLFENGHDSLFVLDPETEEIVDVNRQACEMLGYARDELLSLDPADLHPDEMPEFRAFVNRVLETDIARTDELACRTKDGREVPAAFSASVIQSGDRPLVLVAVRDYVERRKREQFLQELYAVASATDRSFDEKLQVLFELGCEQFDLELGGIARIDPEADLFEVEAVSGDHEHLTPGARVALSETYCRVFTDGAGVAGITAPLDREFEDTVAHEEFGVRTYLGTHIELDNDLDRTLFFVSSEPRDEEFSEVERTLHHLMGQWVEHELERKQHEAQLQRKNDRLESFASMLAHELRNPLTIAQIYQQQAQPRDEDAAEEVETALNRIEEMIDVLLVTARGSKSAIDWEDVTLPEAATDAWTGVSAAAADLVVETERTIRADPVHLRHLLENLFENSVTHGGDTVTVRVGDLEDADGFYVADDGPGIPEDVRDDVFEAGHTTDADGIGLGLTFVKRLAETYGWDCTLTESEEGGVRVEFASVEYVTPE